MCEIGTRKRPHFQQEGGPFFCRILHPSLIPGRHPADAGTRLLKYHIFFFRGRFGISVLSGFPDNHPLWQKNFPKLTLLSHAVSRIRPAKALSKGCYRYPKRCSRDELRSVHRSSEARLLRTAEIKHPCSRFAGTC